MERLYLKALHAASRTEGDGPRVHTFVATTDVLDRQGEIVTADGWQIDNYRQNPVVLDSHDYRSIENILGIAREVRETEHGLEVDVMFNNTPRGRLADQLVEEGNLRAVSVGFISHEQEYDPKGKQPVKHTRKELLEVSVVAVPANPEALLIRGLVQQRGAHPPHMMPMAPEDAPWDAAAEVRQAEGAEALWRMHAWRDDEGDPEAKSSYKLPHHRASSEVVWRGVAAAMAALLGARGGVQIPEGDRKGVYIHLERHYRQFEKEPPEFKSLSELRALGEEEIRGLFYEGEWEMIETKVGRVLSRKNEESLRQARDLIDQVLAALEPAQDEGEEQRALDLDLSALYKFAGKES